MGAKLFGIAALVIAVIALVPARATDKLTFTVLGPVAELERSLIVERDAMDPQRPRKKQAARWSHSGFRPPR